MKSTAHHHDQSKSNPKEEKKPKKLFETFGQKFIRIDKTIYQREGGKNQN